MDIITYILSRKYTDKAISGVAGGLQYKGSKPTVEDLPAPSESIKGHMYTVLSNGHEYVCDGAQWIDLSKDLDNKADKSALEKEINDRTNADATLQTSIDVKADKTYVDEKVASKIETYKVTVDGKAGQYVGEANVPVYFDADVNADKITVNSYAIALNTTKEQVAQKNSLDIPSATEASAGLMSAADKQLLANKQDKLTAGENITINNNVISATGGTSYTAGDNINIENNVISVNAQHVTLASGQTSGTLTDAEIAKLNTPVSYIERDNKHFNLAKVAVGRDGIYLTYICQIENVSESILVNISNKTWTYYTASLQEKLIAGENIVIAEDGKTISAKTSTNAYTNIKHIADYLYEVEYTTKNIDYDYANKYFKSMSPVNEVGGACTGIVSDSRVLRHLDWTYDNNVEFVVRTAAEYDVENNIVKHASIGMASCINGLTKDVVESGAYNQKYKMVPFIMTDGINDAGLYVQSNVVVPLSFDLNPSATTECCITMAVRYILDNCADFNEVENFFNNCHIYNTSAAKYNYHFLIAQGNDWRIIEITADGHKTVGSESSGCTFTMPYGVMTNFRATGRNNEGLVFTDNELDINTVEDYGIGVERFKIAAGVSLEGKTLEEVQSSLLYSNTYLDIGENAWRTEFTDESAGRTVMDAYTDPAKFTEVLQKEQEHFYNRDRNEGENSVWQTTHSAIYDLASKKFNIAIQERLSEKFEFALANTSAGVKYDNITIKANADDELCVNEDLAIKSLTASSTISANNKYFNVGPVYDGGTISSDKPSAISGKGLIALNLMSGKNLNNVGENVVIVGTGCFAKEQSSVACGTGTQAIASYSFASGRETIASRQCTFAGGQGTRADRNHEFVIGKFNKYDIDYQLFVVGNGSSDSNRSNAFVVDSMGNATVSNTLTAVNLSDGTKIKSVSELLSKSVPESIDLTGWEADGEWHDGGIITNDQAAILVANEMNYIWMNGMHRLDFRYRDNANNLATYSSNDGEKCHVIEITLSDKTWRYKHVALQTQITFPTVDGDYKLHVENGKISWVAI